MNDQSTYRRGEYYHKALAVANASAPIWQPVTNRAIYNGETNTTTGNLLIPKSPQTFWYDGDGNTLSDFVWTNSWDAENRMATTENTTAVTTAGRAKQAWTFDNESRWTQRIVYSWNGSGYAPQYTNRLLWQGKMLAAILDHNNGLVVSFLRGLDLSGTLERAGGAGGLLAINIPTNGVHFCAYDANGNVSALVSGAGGVLSGTYEYDSFGKSLRMTGVAAKANTLRFSTQFADEPTISIKYLYRDQQPALGRWPNREPINELGFKLFLGDKAPFNLAEEKALYAFVFNDPIDHIDIDGRLTQQQCIRACRSTKSMAAFCRKIPHPATRAACWGVYLLCGEPCKNFCRWYFD